MSGKQKGRHDTPIAIHAFSAQKTLNSNRAGLKASYSVCKAEQRHKPAAAQPRPCP
jgi:hypothetical protein